MASGFVERGDFFIRCEDIARLTREEDRMLNTAVFLSNAMDAWKDLDVKQRDVMELERHMFNWQDVYRESVRIKRGVN